MYDRLEFMRRLYEYIHLYASILFGLYLSFPREFLKDIIVLESFTLVCNNSGHLRFCLVRLACIDYSDDELRGSAQKTDHIIDMKATRRCISASQVKIPFAASR